MFALTCVYPLLRETLIGYTMKSIMGQNQRSVNSLAKDQARYYPPEMMPFSLCTACLEIVLEQSEKAAEIYEEVIECLSLPGYQETMNQIGEWLPDNRSIIKELVKESGYDLKKPPDKEGLGIPYVRNQTVLPTSTHEWTNIPMFMYWCFSLNRKGKWYQIFVRMAGQTSRRLEHNTYIPFSLKISTGLVK